MKPLVLLILATVAHAAVPTAPVGYVTIKIAAAPAGGGEQLSFRAISLNRAIEYHGTSESIAEAGANVTLTDQQATWTANQFNPPGATTETATHYLEIVRPFGQSTAAVGEGTTFDILATNAATKTLTIAGTFPDGITSTIAFKIRKYWTIGDVFGPANQAGLGAGAVGQADEILIHNPQLGQFSAFYYRIDGTTGSWRNLATSSESSGQKIYPEDGIVIRRRQPNDLNVTLLGAVKIGTTSSPVVPGLNYLGNVYAADMTLASSGLWTGDSATGVQAGAQGEADEILIYNPATRGYRTYYYRLGGIGGSGWRSANDGTASADVRIPAGSSVVVRRRSGAGFNWIAPQHPAGL